MNPGIKKLLGFFTGLFLSIGMIVCIGLMGAQIANEQRDILKERNVTCSIHFAQESEGYQDCMTLLNSADPHTP